MKLDFFTFTNKGGRKVNEDSIGYIEYADGGGLFAVADGLGGELYGADASRIVIDSLKVKPEPARGEVLDDWFQRVVTNAGMSVLNFQKKNRNRMKSTVAALAIYGDSVVWGNVGDSRVYFFHDREIAGVTEDHSVAYKKYLVGEISRDNLRTDIDQSNLLRALGSPERDQPSICKPGGRVSQGDGFLLCSDGLWCLIKDNEMLIDYLKATSAQEWAELLLLRAISRINPGDDNLSLITVLVR